ncbi:hypothetical protein D6855_08580 [Butyrivibrio sp. CB08]|uniref:hypothetical protein n=1 Tax=Butyrivibrio sp. CB08 TaxID=2364879 RepID=UPI000EA9ABEB|nr:hypothetical protein [Butyrivibrio sp. CB08]RKM59831.1 hypothetical protein D6855_08580 [Butyrivibrio sp. CB08]
MPKLKDYNSIKKYIFCLIFALAMGLSIYYGFQKQGFHEDEYYTYFSSNRSLGLYQPDRQWQDRQTILDEFAVKKGEGFNYGLVKLVQSWDVHPPFYYFIFHTLCSLVPGVFTKWTGIITNLIAFAISFLFLALIMDRLRVSPAVEVLTLVFWSLNPQTVSANIFVRMYAWLGALILACAYFHIRFIQDYEKEKSDLKGLFLKLLLPIMVTSYIGFLIQYFYIFFFVFIGIATAAIIAFVKKDIKNAAIYVGCCAVSLMLAVITYPACLSHLFGGYRGSGATGSFFDLGNTGMRFAFFTGLLNDFVFAGGLIIILIVILIGSMLKIASRSKRQFVAIPVKKETRKAADTRLEIIALFVASIGYFLMASKTALLVGSASNRYEMPIYSLLILLIFMDVFYVLDSFENRVLMEVFAAVMLALLIKGHVSDGKVLFLYPEDTAKIEYARDNSSEVAVVMFNPVTAHNVWRLTDEILEYPEVYYMDETNLDKVTDERVVNASRIILYVADEDCQSKAIDNLLDSCDNLSEITWISLEDMWTTFEID